jgi:hypothetical protein
MTHIRSLRVLWLTLVLALLVPAPASFGFGSRVHVRSDLDGDYQTDTASSKLVGSTLRIKIRFSDHTPPVALVAKVPNEPGLELRAYDVDQDHDVDLVLTSIFSPRPVAVWLNNSKGKFKRVSGWVAAFPANDTGPQYRRRLPTAPEGSALCHSEPLPALAGAGPNGQNATEPPPFEQPPHHHARSGRKYRTRSSSPFTNHYQLVLTIARRIANASVRVRVSFYMEVSCV